MQLKWLGHACFRISHADYAIILDPYADGTVPGLPPLRPHAQAVLTSHGHSDHNALGVVHIDPAAGPSPFTVTRVASAHDDQGGALRGENTIHVLEAGGIRAAHLGDLGAMLTTAQLQAIGPVDAVMIPVGGHYTIDALAADAVCRALLPTVIVPMHYRSDGQDGQRAFGFDEIQTLAPFLALSGRPVRQYTSDTLSLSKGMPAQIAQLTFQG